MSLPDLRLAPHIIIIIIIITTKRVTLVIFLGGRRQALIYKDCRKGRCFLRDPFEYCVLCVTLTSVINNFPWRKATKACFGVILKNKMRGGWGADYTFLFLLSK